MKMGVKQIVWLLLLCMVSSGLCAQGLSNRGTEFWTGYGLHQFMERGYGNNQDMVLYLSAEEPADVVVTIRGRTATLVKPYHVAANTVLVTDKIPKDGGPYDCRLYDYPPSFGGTGGDGLFHVSIHIKSDVPIVAYAHIYGQKSSGATMLMPVETWGYTYTALNNKQDYKNDCFSFVYVVAQHDNTVISITPSVPTRDGYAAGVPFQKTLQTGDIYQVVGANLTGEYGYELTGTTVRSIANDAGACYPVGFFAGSSRTLGTCPRGSNPDTGGDNDMQQCFPYEAWGRRYFTAPTSSSEAADVFMMNTYKVVVRDPATVVRKNGEVLKNYDAASKSYYFESTKADYIEADKPVLLAQFMAGGPCLTRGVGDPEMIYLSPIEQGIKRIGFYRNTEENIEVNYLTLIIPKGGLASLTIDGQKDYSYTYPHPQHAGYMVVVKRWAAQKTQCIVKSDSAFTAITYGLGYAESYGYNAGTRINNLNAEITVHNVADTAMQSAFACKGTPAELALYMADKPAKLEWLLSEVSGMGTVADVVQDNPVPAGTLIKNEVTYYKYVLPGTYIFTETGTVDIPVVRTDPLIDNCVFAERMVLSVEVRGAPDVPFDITHPACSNDSVYFQGKDSSTNGFALRQWKWQFDDGTGADTVAVVKWYTVTGERHLSLQVISKEGCIGDTTTVFKISPSPKALFRFTDNACVSAPVTLTDASVVTEGTITEWSWLWGDGTQEVRTSGTAFDKVYTKQGEYSLQLTVKTDKGCLDDTTMVLHVQPKPVAAFSMPDAVCMPEGQAAFTGLATIADASALTYTWYFFDDGSTAADKNPTHTYSSAGSYDIGLKVTSVYGCSDSTGNRFAAFYNKPLADFSMEPSVICQGKTVQFTDISTAENSTVSARSWQLGNNTFSEKPTSSTQYIDTGHYTVALAVTSSAGCMSDTMRKTVMVYRQPVIDAGPSFEVNVGTVVTFQPKVNDSLQVTFLWQPGTLLNNPALLRPSYVAADDVIFTLTATGKEGRCEATDNLTVKVLHAVIVPNIFTPNGDGINDTWDIINLSSYPQCAVHVFNRYGQLVYSSAGYSKPWTGKVNGVLLPAGTYYYTIDLKNGAPIKSGAVMIIL